MSKAVAFLAGFGTGMLDQTRRDEEKARQAKLDKITFDRADREAKTADREDRKQREIEAANADTTVTPGAAVTGLSTDGNAAQYTDADVAGSDLRQARQMAEQTGAPAPVTSVAPKFAANGINFDTQAQAGAAAKAANDPNAKAARSAAVIAKYDPVAGQQMRLANTQVNAAEQKEADQKWNQDLWGAMQAGHEGMAQLVSKSNGGSMAGVQLKAVPTPDGQSVVYNKVNPDGTMVPTKLMFPNTQEGVMQAAYMLDKTVTPAQRMEHILKVNKDEREGEESKAKAGYYDALAGKNNALAENGGTSKKADHFDAKQWDAAGKIDKSVVSLPNAMGDKDVESGDLRSAYLQVFNAAKASGSMAPNEAVEHATTTIVKLKNAAATRVEQALAADPKSKLTIDKAVRDILKESQAFTKKAGPAAAPGAPAGNAPPSSAKQGQIDILNQEMRKAVAAASQPGIDAEARARAQADIQSLTNELGRLGVRGAPAAPPAAAAAAGGIPAAPAAAPAAPPAAAAAAKGIQPGPGAELDTARAAYTAAVSRLNSFGLKQRAADPQGYEKAKADVAAAQQARQAAEAAYSQSVGSVRPAFVAARP
ncbi:hypothetical protein D9M73_50900 [compost metagenome]